MERFGRSETGVVPDQDFVLPWDGTEYEIPSGTRTTLKTAFSKLRGLVLPGSRPARGT